jgi:hypothetical protein
MIESKIHPVKKKTMILLIHLKKKIVCVCVCVYVCVCVCVFVCVCVLLQFELKASHLVVLPLKPPSAALFALVYFSR